MKNPLRVVFSGIFDRETWDSGFWRSSALGVRNQYSSYFVDYFVGISVHSIPRSFTRFTDDRRWASCVLATSIPANADWANIVAARLAHGVAHVSKDNTQLT